VPSTGAPESAQSVPGTLSSEAAPLGNAPADTFDDDGSDGARDSAAVQSSGEGADWLLIAEIVTAIALIASALYVFGPALIKKGR
jgi:hypothetical protein